MVNAAHYWSLVHQKNQYGGRGQIPCLVLRWTALLMYFLSPGHSLVYQPMSYLLGWASQVFVLIMLYVIFCGFCNHSACCMKMIIFI